MVFYLLLLAVLGACCPFVLLINSGDYLVFKRRPGMEEQAKRVEQVTHVLDIDNEIYTL